MRLLCAAVLTASAPDAALAQSWSAQLTASASQADGDNAPLLSGGALALERRFDNHAWVGVSVGASRGETIAPEIDAALDQEALNASVWWGAPVGAFDVSVSVDYIEQRLDGGFSLPGGGVFVDGEVRTLAGAVMLARSFGEDRTLTPSLQLSHAQTDAEYTLAAAGGGVFADIEEDASGLTAAARLDGEAPAGEGLTFSGGVAFLATNEAAAQTYARNGQPRQRQDEGAAQWGEAYLGAEFASGQASSISLQAGATIGRDQDEGFATVSFGWRF